MRGEGMAGGRRPGRWINRVALGVWAVAALACDDDGDPNYTPATGADNGARCIFSPAGATGCRGQECLAFPAAQLGICSEPCTDACRYGGTCARLPDLAERVCMVPCTSGADCQSGFACQPIDGLQTCEGGASCAAPEVNAWCVPFTG